VYQQDIDHMTGPLNGITVVEFAGIGPGPFCAMQLADMGARVLRIERPNPKMTREEAATRVTSRSSRSVALDLKKPDAVDAALLLVQRADVLIEGFRPGVMERLGLGPDRCLEAKPSLVYGRMTGWGQTGPLAHTAGHDIDYIALTGALASIGTPAAGPVPPLNLVGDFGGGGLMLAYAIACALVSVRSTGKGQVIDVGMVDGAASLMTPIYGMKAQGRWGSKLGENLLDGGAPYYSTYRCADGEWVAVGAMEPQFFALLLNQLQIDSQHYGPQTDRAHWPKQRQLLAARFASFPRAHWVALMQGTDSCFAPVLSMDEAASHPHTQARGTFITLDGVLQPAPAARFSRTGCARPTTPPLPGEHSREELQACGLDNAQIARLLAA
jgi:alpha-methylacyl-CoA racemase